jgi:hypothetical protein
MMTWPSEKFLCSPTPCSLSHSLTSLIDNDDVFYIIVGLVTNNHNHNHNYNNLYSCGIDCSLDGGGTNCTCSDVASMINDISSARSEAYTQATAYSTYSQEVVSSLAAYATARSAYDAEYITNKTAGTKV